MDTIVLTALENTEFVLMLQGVLLSAYPAQPLDNRQSYGFILGPQWHRDPHAALAGTGRSSLETMESTMTELADSSASIPSRGDPVGASGWRRRVSL